MLSNYYNLDQLWLDEDGNLYNQFKRNSEDIIENLFNIELLKNCSSQDLVIRNEINKWPLSHQMTCFHGLGSSVMDQSIFDTHFLDRIKNFELLNRHEPDSNHKPLSLSPNLVMHTTHMQETNKSKRHIHFNRSNVDFLLRDLERDLDSLTYNNNIDKIYYHFITTLSTTSSKFSNETSYKQNNITSNTWYAKDCKITRKSIGDAPNEIIKLQNIIIYKDLIKMKKRPYINKIQEHILHLSKVMPITFWWNLLVR